MGYHGEEGEKFRNQKSGGGHWFGVDFARRSRRVEEMLAMELEG